MYIHPAITERRLVSAIKRSMRDDTFPGFCIACGRKAKQPCEPDAREYPCLFKGCGKRAVYGAEELLAMGAGREEKPTTLGKPAPAGEQTFAPAPHSWAPEVIADGSGQWVGNALRFATREAAERYVTDLACRWVAVRDTRVVESTEPANRDENGVTIE